ncbi:MULTISPECIES: hypothetical protein [unclassified Sulfitobacter]|uniref:hypothetical protein n=1 Tax=Sulfitobacter phage pCB2047-C TaxID=754043 RepID=UPI0002C06420|nr:MULTISPECIES: hypothetical protein [unclassified Sulfitobacter]YP_007675275.1 hypothetical protein SUBG_00017 [Sulfitobacter phage pCB2047-C]YP_007675457.1 hypothetical protein SUAG_00065 [Sulfitobacter phage pCB2047-A]YP_009146187.1 hypothetical protein SUFP_013 [Sulfitobacter phage NYA-2014a]AGG91188.1 hypothetical protein SUBG_00017 [Sulfitobacter phage pCB2047-C]AGH30791.1 hypothetical protein SUAG_00065 [Sulfitobacter phage pCB2047-A]AIM40644.1 hypothetical protein SUFP_013 [Sulfitoba|tara:strand:+ start:6774 stop:7130 length:357 start_codon:yes stop_codon:yes gene_type:complete
MWFLKWLTGGVLDRAMQTVDKYVDAQTDREAIKADIIKTHMQTRADWLRAGGFWTLLLFAVPTALHYMAVVLYSLLWCARCAFPVGWTIAALPGAMADWQGYIILASIGGLSLLGMRR